MPLPKIIPGGENRLWSPEWQGDFEGPPSVPNNGSNGQFARYPGSTPKYALNDGPRDAEYRETMARLFIEMPAQERALFVKSVPAETRPLAKILCGAGSGAAGGTGFMDFLLTSANESFQEKLQIVESLSDNFIVYVFGQKAPIFQYSGVLYNTYQDDQRVWMTRIYRDIARGTQLARRKKLIRLRYDSVIVSGIMVSMQQALKGDSVNWAEFSFSLIPMQYVIFTPDGGQPTELKTAFTESAGLGLRTTSIPSTKRLRTASATRPSMPTAKPAALPESSSPVADVTKTQVKRRSAQKVLTNREKTQGPKIKIHKNLRGSTFHQYRPF